MASFVLQGGWLTTKEVAELLRVHPKHVYRLLRRGLPARQVGGHWRFSPAEVREWMARGRRSDESRRGNKALQSATSEAAPTLIVTNGDLAIDRLVSQVNAERPSLGLVHADAATAMDWLTDGAVLAVGVLGDCVAPPGEHLARMHVAYEQFGLAASPGRPVPAVASLLGRGHRLASWPEGSDLRNQLDGVLRREGVDARRVHVRATTLDSHADVISALLCGRATLGVTTVAWAQRHALPFVPLGSRPLGLVVQATSLGHPALIRCWHTVQSVGFADALTELGGLDPSDAGRISYLMGEVAPPKTTTPGESGALVPDGCNWVLMLRARGAASSKPLTQLAEALRSRGVSVAGFVQAPRRRQGEVVSYELRRLFGTDRVVLARRGRARSGSKPAAQSFQFVSEAFSEARGWLEQDGRQASVLIIDGVGTLEGRGKGHHDALVWAARQPTPKVVIVALRRDQAAVISNRLGVASRQLAVSEVSASKADRDRLVETIVAAVGP